MDWSYIAQLAPGLAGIAVGAAAITTAKILKATRKARLSEVLEAARASKDALLNMEPTVFARGERGPSYDVTGVVATFKAAQEALRERERG